MRRGGLLQLLFLALVFKCEGWDCSLIPSTLEVYLNACHKGFIDFFIFLSHILPLLHFVVVFFPPHIPSHPVSLSIALSAYPSAYLQVYWMNSVVFVLYQIHLLEKYSESAIYETVSVFLFIKVCVEVYKLCVREETTNWWKERTVWTYYSPSVWNTNSLQLWMSWSTLCSLFFHTLKIISLCL